uniref:procollagen-proline 4-dioxygenase n=1 Tax=Salarias fasciatus TaxID=181472 RepID=A0A672JLI6_SALFA
MELPCWGFLLMSCLQSLSAHNDFFTSIGQMTDLLYTEKDLVTSLKDYIRAEENKLEQVKRWADKLDLLTATATKDPEGFLGHPVNAFKLMKRLNTEWSDLESLVLRDTTDGFISNLTIQRQYFPTDEDQTGAAKALLRLQDTYRLDTNTISIGDLPATVHDPQTGKLTTAQYRVSKSAWLTGYDDPMIDTINQRIEDLTGLEMDTAEELQVANYGVGGQYEPHFDFGRKDEPDAFKELGTGNRIATWLFYMSDVSAGGATVFPDVGAAVWPMKGTAVFWYNLFPSGEGDYSTRHAACPVLVGNKWVSNKWIHERGQEWRRPCGLSEAD